MITTGVFATEAENRELRELIHEAQITSAILLFGRHDLSGDAWHRTKQRIHAIALERGLPEIPGFYGFDGRTGEFLR